ncbi:BTB/POZ domain-containing protein At4g08455-like [Triticum urartu]|uniref:BTB/POZ domain-containing protein At4g08455-like n=1 Tax=Triticum urartu TaxID=4572 RepID=UPI0020439995|nr:BTB/POZ domain-containing protein At4g08455-like [Triticum urartu]
MASQIDRAAGQTKKRFFTPRPPASLDIQTRSHATRHLAPEKESSFSRLSPFSYFPATASRSLVFRAMLDNEMEESRSGVIEMYDVSYDVLRAFVHYMYTGEALLDEQMACDLLVLAEKYEVKHLKTYREKFITSKVNKDNTIVHYAFAHRHDAKQLLEASMSALMDSMPTLAERGEYKELVERDPRILVEIYETYVSRQDNTAAERDSDCCCSK